MHVFITGGLGFVGRHLTNTLLTQGHEVTVTGTRQAPEIPHSENFRYIPADTSHPGDWQQSAAGADVVVNLAGRNIFKRWRESYKQQIYDSRILTTRNLVAALDGGSSAIFISTSAMGFYGNRGDDLITETEEPGTDFLATLSRDWEAEALVAENKGLRVAIPRFGIVLGADGGALAKMLPAFKLFLGGPMGTGRQWFSWIHIKDLVAALQFLVQHENCTGIFNFTAPQPVRYSDFTTALGRALGRPTVLKTPAFALRLALGELGDAVLASQRVVPRRLLEAGYNFQFSDIDSAMADLIRTGTRK